MPVKKIKYGGVEICVFERDSEKYGKQQSYSISRNYKKGEEWVKNVVYLNNTTDVINTIQCCQALLDYKYFKDTIAAYGLKESQDEECPI